LSDRLKYEDLKYRFREELPLWRLSPMQTISLLVWAAWPWFSLWAFPENAALAFAPVFIFLPFAYPVGGMFMAFFPGLPFAYALGVSVTIFALAYLGLVSWRQARVRRHRP